jgi:hypothetical protein
MGAIALPTDPVPDGVTNGVAVAAATVVVSASVAASTGIFPVSGGRPPATAEAS